MEQRASNYHYTGYVEESSNSNASQRDQPTSSDPGRFHEEQHYNGASSSKNVYRGPDRPTQDFHGQNKPSLEKRDKNLGDKKFREFENRNLGYYNQYEEQTAVSEASSNNPYDTSVQISHRQARPRTPSRAHSPEEIRRNDELLSLLIGGKEETKAEKRERQRMYREALENQKKLNEFYTKNLNPEVIEHKYSKSPPRFSGKNRQHSPSSPLSNSFDSETEKMIEQEELEKKRQYQEILHYQMREKELKKQLQRKESIAQNIFARDENQEEREKLAKQNQLRRELEEQIQEKQRLGELEKQKKQKYDLQLDTAIENMNKRMWDQEKTESQREKEKDQYKDELQNQIKEKQMKEDFEEQQKKMKEIEDEKRVKREVFELNNQFRIENGDEPLPLPPELTPSNIPHDFDDQKSLAPSMAPSVPPEMTRNPSPTAQQNRFTPQIPPLASANPEIPSSNPTNAPQMTYPPYQPSQSPLPQAHYEHPYYPVQAPPPGLIDMPPRPAPADQNLEALYPELQELRDRQKDLIGSYMGEIQLLKKQKEGLIQDMISNKKDQMEEDHKLFQQKLEQLKGSMLENYEAPKPTPVMAKGNEILAELDRMKERLQKGKSSKPSQHPSERTMNNIMIQNPLADGDNINIDNYSPEKRSFQTSMDKSLPGITALKTGPNASQNYSPEKPSKNTNPSILKPDNVEINMGSPTIPSKKKTTMKSEKPRTKKRIIKKKDKPSKAKTIRLKVPLKNSDNNDESLESQKVDESIQKELPRAMIQAQNNLAEESSASNATQEIRQDDPEDEEDEGEEMYTNEELAESDLPNPIPQDQEELLPREETKNDPQEAPIDELLEEDEPEEPLLDGERPGSPIIPALRKKLVHSQTIREMKEKSRMDRKSKPYRSVTQIGQGEDKLDEPSVIPEHLRNKSVTGLGIDDDRSVAVPMEVDQSRDYGKPPLAKVVSQTPKNEKSKLEEKFKSSKKRKFTDMVSLQGDSEQKKESNDGPITERKEYHSAMGSAKNSFRKLILGTNDEASPPPHESSSENEASLMHGLPASMKKIRGMSMDRSRQMALPPTPKKIIRAPNTTNMEKDESGSDVDFDLKFFNKKALQSGGSLPRISAYERAANHKKANRTSSFTKYQSPNPFRPPVDSNRSLNERNSSFEEIPRANLVQRRDFKEPEGSYQPSEHLEGVKTPSLRETISRSVPRMRNQEIIKRKETFGDSHAKKESGSSYRRDQVMLEHQRKALGRGDKFNDSQYIGEDVSNYQPNEVPLSFERSKPKQPSVFNYNSQARPENDRLPQLSRRDSLTGSKVLTKKQQEVATLISEKAQNPSTKNIEPRRVIDPIYFQKNKEENKKSQQKIPIRKRSTSLTNLSHNIANESVKSYKLPTKPKFQPREVPKNSNLQLNVPNYESEMLKEPSEHFGSVDYNDPYVVHERLKRNMMLYVDTDPNNLNSTPLEQRLDAELKTITPAKMGSSNHPFIDPKYSLESSRPIPIETKKSIVSEASDFIKYYENMKNKENIYNDQLDESLDDFVLYLKGLKNKFLEDLVLKKIEMVEDEAKQKKLLQSYPQRQSLNISQDSTPRSNRVLLQESDYENLRDFEKEVNKAVSEEQIQPVGSITILKEPTENGVTALDVDHLNNSGINQDLLVSESDKASSEKKSTKKSDGLKLIPLKLPSQHSQSRSSYDSVSAENKEESKTSQQNIAPNPAPIQLPVLDKNEEDVGDIESVSAASFSHNQTRKSTNLKDPPKGNMFLDSPAEPPQQNLLMNHVSEEVKLPLETSVEKTSINKLSIPEDQKPLQMRDSVTPPLESGRSSKMSNKPPKYPSQITKQIQEEVHKNGLGGIEELLNQILDKEKATNELLKKDSKIQTFLEDNKSNNSNTSFMKMGTNDRQGQRRASKRRSVNKSPGSGYDLDGQDSFRSDINSVTETVSDTSNNESKKGPTDMFKKFAMEMANE
ncbi:unnamed protein product [Moneuplotes crassus]|uniref:Uncharacterized protein n=2 Tax=Euplotes crassus TaxID=5936 RepID=A0AAD1XQG6_EUPCR|nr:unnamed protein product [Moneuplotes crassus]